MPDRTFPESSAAPWRAWLRTWALWLLLAPLCGYLLWAYAQEHGLPLITNDPSTHDWWRLLRAADLLAYVDVIGGCFLGLAVLAFGLALLVPRAPI